MIGSGVLSYAANRWIQDYVIPWWMWQVPGAQIPWWYYLWSDILVVAWFMGAALFLGGIATVIIFFSLHRTKANRAAAGRL